MYCYTYVNQFSCIFNELQLWSHISSEHPNFIKTVAALSKVNLPKATENQLEDIHKMFLRLYNKVLHLKKTIDGNPNLYAQHVVSTKKLIDEFILHDTHALSFYPELLKYGTDNKAFMELIKHIISEQAFMLELFKDLRKQVR